MRAALKAKPKEILHILERAESLADAAEDENGPEEGIFSEEDRRLLDLVRRELGADRVDDDASDRPPRPQFTFE